MVEVVDPMGFAAGRFRLEAGPDGAKCVPTGADADLAVPAGALGAAYLGGHSWARLAAGRLGRRAPAPGRSGAGLGPVLDAAGAVVRPDVLSPDRSLPPSVTWPGGPGEAVAAQGQDRGGHVAAGDLGPSTWGGSWA